LKSPPGGVALAMWLLTISPVTLVAVTSALQPRSARLEQREPKIFSTVTRAAQFVAVPHITSNWVCEKVQPPQALTTPDPLFASSNQGRKIKVSFIIGTDGMIHSPLILESAGLAGDRRVLQTVRTWRYRPATCNGFPTETEGNVEFSGQ
jgi:TonB family protein